MRVLLPVIVLLFLVGCGDEEPAPAAAAGTPTATATATATPNPATEIRALVTRYYETVAGNDPEGTCETLAPSEQEHFDRKFGECAKAFRFKKDIREAVEGNRAGSIKVDGDRAKIAVTSYAGDDVDEPLYAIKVDDQWWIARSVAYRRAG